MKNSKITLITKLLLGLAAVLLIISIFVPLWRIELDAPQYPEGLALLIFTNKIGGDVDIINGLNHYIGMQTLHAENFIEFTILPYIVGFYALFTLMAMWFGNKNILYVLFTAFLLFGVIAMIDFWRWEYNYGHNLDPKAAIIVPGMSYQPPLIGFKQLLNFGAYSIPDIGGWLFIISGILMLVSVIKESSILKRFKKKSLSTEAAVLIPFLFILNSCSSHKPEPILLNKDMCSFCQMTISDGRFGCEVITEKGKIFKFDDLDCMLAFKNEKVNTKFKMFFVNDFSKSNILEPVESSFFIESIELNSPMGGNFAAFANKTTADSFAMKYHSEVFNWEKIKGR
jgi:copper chaperone NosL